jgi:hypothetical protein
MIAFVSLPVSAEDTPSPVTQFLRAADNNDFPAMRAAMAEKVPQMSGRAISREEFLKKIESCYLRRVYASSDDGRVIAAWMCSEGEEKSRVVLAQVQLVDGQIQVSLAREDRNNRPAPPRLGSAFAEEPK